MSDFSIALKDHFSQRKNFYYLLAKAVIGIGLIVFIIVKVNFNEILDAISKTNGLYLAAGAGFLPINLYLQYKKWELTCGRILNIHDKKRILLSLFYGLSGGAFTPARIGEYGGRKLGLKEKSFFEVSSATFIEKIMVLIVEIVFGFAAAALFVIIMLGPGNYIYLYSFAVILAIGAIVLVLSLRNKKDQPLKKFLLKVKFFKKRPEFVESIFSLDKSYFIKMIIITVLFYGCYISQFAFFSASLSNEFNFVNYIWAGSLIVFSKSLLGSISFGELGIREGASVYFLTKFGETAATGFSAAVFLFLINILLPALTGLILMLTGKND